MSQNKKIEQAAQWIAESQKQIIFTGAGISTDSGLPDYRGPDGLWTRRDKGLPPPKSVPWELVKPNQSHLLIVELLKIGKLDFLISQNVDGLHAKSGIPFERLAELHGNQHFMKCLKCHKKYTFKEANWDKNRWGSGYRTQPIKKGQPNCPNCGGRIISSIVNFGDPMPEDEMLEASIRSEESDVFFVIGSSLMVSPANTFPLIAKRNGAKLIILNDGETPYDGLADIRFFDRIKNILPPIVNKVKEILSEK